VSSTILIPILWGNLCLETVRLGTLSIPACSANSDSTWFRIKAQTVNVKSWYAAGLPCQTKIANVVSILALQLRKGRPSLGIGSTKERLVDNRSLGGLFIRTPDPPPAGTFIQLRIDAPTGEVRARAAVQRSSPKQGMGVKFIAMEHEHRARFAGWLKALSS
jgi:hypothetical protein